MNPCKRFTLLKKNKYDEYHFSPDI
jgi:hypothetical protein